MTLNAAEEKIVNTVESLREGMLDFTCRLVAQPSTLGKEISALELFAQELRRLSLSPVRVPLDDPALKRHPGYAPVLWDYAGKYCVAAVRAADASNGRSALFNGHLDVVDPEPIHFWDTDPFVPEIRGGRIYGRGAGDMKSGVAAMVYALYAVEKAGLGLAAPVTIEGVIDEECSGNGALACLNAGYDADAVLIPEPFGPTILTAQVGVLWFRIRVKGKPVHVLEAPAGTNAIEKCFPIIQSLRVLEKRLNQERVPEEYADIPHPLNLNIGVFKGGNWPSTVAAEAELHGRLSFFPGVGYAETCGRIADAVAALVQQDDWLRENPPELSFYGFRSEGHSVAYATPAFATLNQCHQSLTHQDAAAHIATCTTDLSRFQAYGGGQSTCYGPEGGNFHGANEWVDMESIVHTAKTYALFLARWCRLVE